MGRSLGASSERRLPVSSLLLSMRGSCDGADGGRCRDDYFHRSRCRWSPPLRAHRVATPSANPDPTQSTAGSLTERPYHPHIQHANLGITSIYLQGIDSSEIIDTVHRRPAPMLPASAGLR
jgi:hypothetical protein